jgi:hypothetical protein
MRCGNCGRTLTEAALALGYCPSCGAHLTEDSIPQKATVLTESRTASAPLAERIPSQPVKSLPIPEQMIAPPPVPDRPAQEQPVPTTPVIVSQQSVMSPSTKALIALVSVLIIVIGVAGVLIVVGQQGHGPFAKQVQHGTPVATSAATSTLAPTGKTEPTATSLPSVPTPTLAYMTYTSSDQLFGLNYPRNWTAQDKQTIAGTSDVKYPFQSPDQTELFQIVQSPNTIDASTASQIMQTYVTNDSGSDLQVSNQPASFTSGSNTWTRTDGTYTKNSQTVEISVLLANHGGKGYTLIYTGIGQTSPPIVGTVFATMVSTFTFLR